MCGILSVNDTDLCACVPYTQGVCDSSQKKYGSSAYDSTCVISEQINYSSVIIVLAVHCRTVEWEIMSRSNISGTSKTAFF